MPLVLLALLAALRLNPAANEPLPHDLLAEVAASGRALMGETPDARVAPHLQLPPGVPPLLSFRFYEGKQRHRFGDVDIMLDDAGH